MTAVTKHPNGFSGCEGSKSQIDIIMITRLFHAVCCKARQTSLAAVLCALPLVAAPQAHANTPPTVSAISDQTVAMNGSITVNFTVGDAETPAGDLIVNAYRGAGDLFPEESITVGGSGSNRTATFTPAANKFGDSRITINVDDGAGLDGNGVAESLFLLTVTPGNTGTASITSVTPPSGKVGQVVDIAGSGLIGPNEGTLSSTTLIWYSTRGVAETSYGNFSWTEPDAGSTATNLKYTVPSGSRSSTLVVTVETLDSSTGITMTSVAVAPSSFTFIPSIDSMTPSLSQAGQEVDILGGGFNNATEVRFNGTVAPIQFKDDNYISTTVPAGATTGPVSVITSDVGTIVSSINYVIGTNIRPTISPVPPQTVAMSTPVTVNFTVGDSETPVNNLTVTAVASDAGLVPASGLVPGGIGANRSLTITPAAGQFGALNIYVRVSDNSGALNQITETSFRLRINGGTLGNAVISGFTPSTGRAGTLVTISGSGLMGPEGNYLNTTTVYFKEANGDWVAAYPEDGSTATSLKVIVPALARTGPLTVTVDTYNLDTEETTHDIVTSGSNYSINAIIDSFSPSQGEAGQTVQIQGTGFTNATSVSFNGGTVTIAPNDKTETTISVPVPASASTGNISVITHDAGTAVSATPFTFIVNDAVAPIEAIVAAPASGSTVLNLNSGISGSARDNAGGSGIAGVDVVLGRNRNGADEFWGFNTATSTWEWSLTPRTLTAVLASPNALQTNWTVTANLPSGPNLTAGVYFVGSVARDRAANSYTGTTQNFTVTADSTPPTVAVTTPANGAAIR